MRYGEVEITIPDTPPGLLIMAIGCVLHMP